jgi:DNA recombination protein RmuC
MLFTVILTILTAAVAAGMFLLWQGLGRQLRELREAQKNDQAMSLMSQWMQDTRASLDSRLAESRQVLDTRLSEVDRKLGASMDSVNQRLDGAARVISDVNKQLGTLSKTAENMQEVGKNISSLQDILRSPKIRGGLGEYFLADLLSQILPPQHYQLQYVFGSGDKVDAVVRLSGKLVPVDAKFPLENFRRLVESQTDEERKRQRREFVRDVKKHVDAIAKKYILPDEGTFDFALMYIPAENVYYETIIKDEAFGEDKSIANYAIESRVIPVSPNSFYAYLQAIVLGLRGMRVEERAQEIIDSLARLKGDLARFRGDFETVGTHLKNAANRYDEAEKRLAKFEDRLEGVEGRQMEAGAAPKEIEA